MTQIYNSERICVFSFFDLTQIRTINILGDRSADILSTSRLCRFGREGVRESHIQIGKGQRMSVTIDAYL